MELFERAFQECRPWMFPVLAGSIVVLAVVIERAVMFGLRWSIRGDVFLAMIEKLVTAGNPDRAAKLVAAAGPHVPIGRVVQAGLEHADEGTEGVRRAMESVVVEVRPSLRKRIFALLALGNATVMLGVLGTQQLGGFSPPAGAATPLPFHQPMAMAPLMAAVVVDAVATLAFVVFFFKARTIEQGLAAACERLPGLFAGRERRAERGEAPTAEPAASETVPRLGGLGRPGGPGFRGTD